MKNFLKILPVKSFSGNIRNTGCLARISVFYIRLRIAFGCLKKFGTKGKEIKQIYFVFLIGQLSDESLYHVSSCSYFTLLCAACFNTIVETLRLIFIFYFVFFFSFIFVLYNFCSIFFFRSPSEGFSFYFCL